MSKIDVSPVYRDRQYWVCIKMLSRSPLVGFIKGADGVVRQVEISHDPERRRKIKLMVRDGMPIEEINAALEYDITPGEEREHIQRGRFS